MENYKLSKFLKLKVLVALTIAVTLSLGFYMYRDEEKMITLSLDQDVSVIASRASTVKEFLKEQDISVPKGGYINMSLEKELEKNLTIMIKTPKKYTISSAGADLDVVSTYTTVEEILSDLGFELEKQDYTYPDRRVRVSTGAIIKIYDVEEVVEVVKKKIPFESIVRKNKSLEIGTSKIVQKGKEGIMQVETTKKYVNGKLTGKNIVKEKLLTKPVSNITEKGSKERIVTSRGDTNYRKALVMNASAYDLSFASCGKSPGDRGYGITASGTKARPGAVAVDPKVIKLGTKLYIESLDGTKDYGFAVAEDTGGAIKGNKIDLFFHSSKDVKNFGRRKVKVYILN